MGTLEWVVLVAGLAVGIGWWLRSLGKPSKEEAKRAPRPTVEGPPVLESALEDQGGEAEEDDEDDEEALARVAAEKGVAAIDDQVQVLLADFRKEDDVTYALPILVEKLGAPGAGALAEALARLAIELRPTVLDTLEAVASEVGKPLVGPLLEKATPENARGTGQMLGAVLADASGAEQREELGLRAIVQAQRSQPDRAEVFQEVLERVAEALSSDARRELLSHPVPEVRAAAALHCGPVADKTVKALFAERHPRVRLALLANASLWSDRRDLVVPFFRDPSPEVRIEACLRAGWEHDGEVERLREDADRAVALVARASLEDEGTLERIDEALASGDGALRRAACKAAGACLEEEAALKVFGALQLDGSPAEVKAFLEELPGEELPSLEHLVRYARTDPPADVAEVVRMALSYNDDLEGAPDLPLQLLDRGLPPRVRRLGFEALISVDEGRAKRLEPLLVPDEPQLADFLWALHFTTAGAEDDEKALYRRLRGSPNAMLAAFAEEAES